jgi:hypothetical protein
MAATTVATPSRPYQTSSRQENDRRVIASPTTIAMLPPITARTEKTVGRFLQRANAASVMSVSCDDRGQDVCSTESGRSLAKAKRTLCRLR